MLNLTSRVRAGLRRLARSQTVQHLWHRAAGRREALAIGAPYERWIEARELLGPPPPRVSSEIPISVVVPVYNPPERLLIACIESVLNQSYQHWQLCLANDGSSQPHVRRILDAYARQDARVRVIHCPSRGHICAASNAALGLATGDYVALLDHDDMLAPTALQYVAAAIEEHPEALLIYSDEDKIDHKGRRYDPHFKSDWNPELLLSHNYICHLMVIQRELVTTAGGFRPGYEGSQDHDLALRCTSSLTAHQIHHIPRILYHWRAAPGSTARTSANKSYAAEAGRRAVREAVAKRDPHATVEPGPVPFSYRVRYSLPSPPPCVELIVPSRDNVLLLRACVSSLLEQTRYPGMSITIVDNGSVKQDTLAYLREISGHANVRVLPYPHPFNFAAINNFAVEQSQADVVGLVNDDITVIDPHWLREMVSLAWQPHIGCVGAKLLYPDDTVQHAGVILGIGGVAGHSHKHFPRNHPGYFSRAQLRQNVSAVTAACLVLRRSVYLELGGMDAANLAVAFNDVDFCLRARAAGYHNVFTPYAELYHHESASRGPEDNPVKVARFRQECEYMLSRWGDDLRRDPYYSPNLTLQHEDFSLPEIETHAPFWSRRVEEEIRHVVARLRRGARLPGDKLSALRARYRILREFDPAFYVRHTPDSVSSGMTALEHYRKVGWREGRDPSSTFSTSEYLRVNPDVREAEINPLEHWLIFGEREGRPRYPSSITDHGDPES